MTPDQVQLLNRLRSMIEVMHLEFKSQNNTRSRDTREMLLILDMMEGKKK